MLALITLLCNIFNRRRLVLPTPPQAPIYTANEYRPGP